MLPSNTDRSFPPFLQTVLEDIRFSWKLLQSNAKFSLVTRESFLLTLPGLVLGTAAALVVVRCFRSMLVGVSPGDPR